MNQYCRYCSNAEDYNGESTDFLCFAEAPCGDNGNGAFYPARKAKRINHCKHFDFCEIDIFTGQSYSPRIKSDPPEQEYEQLHL